MKNSKSLWKKLGHGCIVVLMSRWVDEWMDVWMGREKG